MPACLPARLPVCLPHYSSQVEQRDVFPLEIGAELDISYMLNTPAVIKKSGRERNTKRDSF